ncbi:MAG: hypothetical protein J3K34DRAFT_434564 [Monoraphidium minutum]|nr:MAG: hypothetical protein J3K34DRAFT_434564 [Monoraphidium minutum]
MAVTTSPAGRRGLAAAPLLALALGLLAAAPAPALAQVVYTFTLNGSNVEPPNGSPGTGTATVTLDPPLATRRRLVDINTMLLQINLSYLDSGMLAAQFHAPTPSPNTGTVGIAWSVPPGYGFGDTSFSLDMTYDMTDASYFNPTFVENNGGIVGARDALFAAFGAGTAYLSIETFGYPTGEIRGFSVPADPGGGADPHLQAFSGQSYEVRASAAG